MLQWYKRGAAYSQMTVMTITVMTVFSRIPHFFLLPIYKDIFYIIIIYIYIIYNIHFM